MVGRWLTLASFGRVDDQAEQQTIPDWMLPTAAKAALRRERGAARTEGETAGGGEPPHRGGTTRRTPRRGGTTRRAPHRGGTAGRAPRRGGTAERTPHWGGTARPSGTGGVADPPEGPVTHWTSPEGARRAVRVRTGELACTSDLQSGRTVSRKKTKYEPLACRPCERRGGM